MYENIEPYVIISSKKTKEGLWIWTRQTPQVALDLARNINKGFMADRVFDVVISVYDVATGTIIGRHC